MFDRLSLDADCASFDEDAAELALELLEPGRRDPLLAHAERCQRCRDELQSLSSAADRLLTLAPEAEPPVGFDVRVLESTVPVAPIHTAGNRPATVDLSRHRGSRRRLLMAAAGVVVVAGIAGLIGRSLATGPVGTDERIAALDHVDFQSVRSATLLDSAGTSHGTVLVTNGARQTLTMTLSGIDEGRYHCSTRGADGTLTEVAAWNVPATGTGTWAVAVSRSLEQEHEIVITEDDGSIVASGALA